MKRILTIYHNAFAIWLYDKVLRVIILCRSLIPFKLVFVVGLQIPSSYKRLYALSIAIMIKTNANTGMWKQGLRPGIQKKCGAKFGPGLSFVDPCLVTDNDTARF